MRHIYRLAAVIETATTGDVFNAPEGVMSKVLCFTSSSSLRKFLMLLNLRHSVAVVRQRSFLRILPGSQRNKVVATPKCGIILLVLGA